MAVAILGGALTAILSAQASIAASNKIGNNLGMALSLGRCRMTEVEEKLLKFGYPDVEDTQTEVACCDDKDVPGFTCESRVERVLMPTPPSMMNTSDRRRPRPVGRDACRHAVGWPCRRVPPSALTGRPRRDGRAERPQRD